MGGGEKAFSWLIAIQIHWDGMKGFKEQKNLEKKEDNIQSWRHHLPTPPCVMTSLI
jgi:hypothetical protein